MRGNLVWKYSQLADKNVAEFVADENGYWRLGDDNYITPYHKSAVDDLVERRNSFSENKKWVDEANKRNDILRRQEQAKQEDNFWNEELVGEFAEWYRKRQGSSVACWGEDMIKIFKKEKQAKQESNTPEYVITAIRKDGLIYYGSGDKYSNYICESPFSMINVELANSFEIYSVQRKSDGFIFTVDELTEQGKIESFKKYCDDIVVNTDRCSAMLSNLSKKKETDKVDMDAPLLSVRDVMEIVDWVITDACKAASKSRLIELAKHKMKS